MLINSLKINSKYNEESKKSLIRTFAMIKPDCYLHIGKILNIIELNGFTIGNLKMFRFSTQEA